MKEANAVTFITDTRREYAYAKGQSQWENEGDESLVGIILSFDNEEVVRYTPDSQIADTAHRKIIAEAAAAMDIYVWQVEDEVDALILAKGDA